MAHDVFVSYSNKDKPTADALVATLEQHNIRCWVAPRDVAPGKAYAASLVQAINISRVLVLVFSSSANTSPHVMREIERAASKSIPILPIRIEDVSYSDSMEYFISSTHWLDALTLPLQQHLERLAASVAALLDADDTARGTETATRPPGIAPITLELGPPRTAGLFGARLTGTSHDLTLRNSGDDSVDFQLHAEDDEGHCAFSLPDGVRVPPHGATTVTIKVRPRARRWWGDREIRWFSVMASSGDGGQPPTVVSGQFEDLPYGWVPYGGGAFLSVAGATVFAVTQLVGGDDGISIQAVTPTPTSAETVQSIPTPTLPALTQTRTPEDTAGVSTDAPTVTPTPTSPPEDTAGASTDVPTATPTQTPPPEDTARPCMDVLTAFALLGRAVDAKDLSRQGQVGALETLLAAGCGFENADLSGIQLAGGNLRDGVFSGAMLAGSGLSMSTAVAADFTGVNLRFTDLDGANLTGAELADARLDFADAESTLFANAHAERASFYGADLRGADFSGADLRGASFFMADLSGARLDGANLEDTLFYATLLEDVTFQDATFKNTEITGSALSEGALTPAQAGGTCTTLEDMASLPALMKIALTEEIPNSGFSGGIEASNLMTYAPEFWLEPFRTSGLARCAARSDDNPMIWREGRLVLTDIRIFFDTALLSKAGRRIDWVNRIVVHMLMMMEKLNASRST